MNFNNIFKDDVNAEFFYSNYPGNKMVTGTIDLEYAIERLKKKEFYTLVTYKEGDELPEEYVPIKMADNNGTLFATINPNILMQYICKNGGIQRASLISRPNANPVYLLGPGDDTISLFEIVNREYDNYIKQNTPAENTKGI